MAWKLPEKITVSQWADKYRTLGHMTSSEPGRWRTDRTPYLRGVMDAFSDPLVEEITLIFPTQTGKTEAGLNVLGYIIDQDPAPTLWVMAREADAKSFSADRIHDMVRLSGALNRHKTIYDDDFTKLEMKFSRMILYLTGANSPAALASKPIRYLILDETDKYPMFSGKEADPIKLATERTRTFWNRKIIKSSTPTTRTGYIYREFERSDQCKFFVPCPHCGEYQVLVFGQIKWPEGERDARRIREMKSAWYECVYCNNKITDINKNKMLLDGRWVQEGASISKDGTITGSRDHIIRKGFWINALYSPWLTFSDIAAEFLLSKDEPALLMNFVNSWLAEVWEEKTEDTTSGKVESLMLEYPEGSIPEGAHILTAGIDVQKDHFYMVIRAWGLREESWLVRACRIESWEELIIALFQTDYRRVDAHVMNVRLACIDSGYRTDEVYEVCRRNSGIARAIKGEVRMTDVPYKISRIDRNPRTGATIPGGLSLWRIDTGYYKDKISRLISQTGSEPAKWHIFKNLPRGYMEQFCSEHKIIIRDRKTGRAHEEWRKKTNTSLNHYFDCEVYATAAADMLHISSMRDPGERMIYQGAKNDDTESKRRESWMGTRPRGWVHR